MRIVGNDLNGLRPCHFGNNKLESLKIVLRNLEADVESFQEPQNTWADVGTENGLYDLLKTGVVTITRTRHNTHEGDGILKYGRTAMVSFYLVSSYVVDSGADDCVLSRWTWMRSETPKVKRTRIVSAYAPVYSKAVKKNLVYQQHLRHL